MVKAILKFKFRGITLFDWINGIDLLARNDISFLSYSALGFSLALSSTKPVKAVSNNLALIKKY